MAAFAKSRGKPRQMMPLGRTGTFTLACDYEVFEDGAVVGRSTSTHGYEPTREAAMTAFAKIEYHSGN
jgi:hypothetical protein